MDLNKSVINKLKEMRIKGELSQDKLSELSGLDIKYINKLENGRFNLTLPTLERILQGLSISHEEFFKSMISNNQTKEVVSDSNCLDLMSDEKKIEFISELVKLLNKYEN